MDDDGFEVLDADDDVEAWLDVEVVKVGRIDGHCCDEWVLENLFAVGDLLGVAFEHAPPVFSSENVQHLGLGAKVLDVFFDSA